MSISTVSETDVNQIWDKIGMPELEMLDNRMRRHKDAISLFETEIYLKREFLEKALVIREAYSGVAHDPTSSSCDLITNWYLHGPLYFLTKESNRGELFTPRECITADTDSGEKLSIRSILMKDAWHSNCSSCGRSLPVIVKCTFLGGGTHVVEYDTYLKSFETYCFECLKVNTIASTVHQHHPF